MCLISNRFFLCPGRACRLGRANEIHNLLCPVRLCTVPGMPERPRFFARTSTIVSRLALVAMVVPGLALAGQVKGKILGLEKLINPVWNEAKDVAAHRFSWREPSPTVRAEFRNLFAYAPKEVCIAALAPSAQQPPPMPMLITVGGGRTSHVTVVVAPGTRIIFENRDPYPHRLYGVKIPTLLPVGNTAALGKREWSAPPPGKYEIRDELFPSLRTWIVVEPNVAAITYPTTTGTYQFPPLGPGEYTIKAYFAGAPTGTPKTLTIGGNAVDVTLAAVEGADKPAAPDAGARK
jgi:hypothetical protein